MADRGDKSPYNDELQTATGEWDRFRCAIDNGHAEYVETARRNFRYTYVEGGAWTDVDRAYMESVQGRKCVSVNHILPAVQTAIGEQIATRTDISYQATKGQSSADTATALSKFAKHVLAGNGYHRASKQVWKNGLVKQRGFFDVRMDFDGNLKGEVAIKDIDPQSVIPDMYANTYDPDGWKEVTLFSWLSLDEIEGKYGSAERKKVESVHGMYEDDPFRDEFKTSHAADDRVGFAIGSTGYVPFHQIEAGERRYRVVERQFYRMNLSLHYVDPATGDTKLITGGISQAEAVAYAAQNGLLLQKINVKRVRWRVCTRLCVLHDEWSPYRTFTIIPFFYLFDYGHTMGMVDPAIGPQDLENKSLTSELHILTTTSNSGWLTPNKQGKNTLLNMSLEQFTEVGMKSGLNVEYDVEIGPPTKILPNQVPVGFDRLSAKGNEFIKNVTGMSNLDQKIDGNQMSGVAIQAIDFKNNLQLADPLDNFAHTEILLGRKIVELAQDFITSERMFKIIGTDKMTGKPTEETVILNQVDATGAIINDITVGEYEVEVTSSPTASTFDDSQFRVAVTLRSEAGVTIPDDEMIRLSPLANKYELAERMSNPDDGGVAAAQSKLLEARIGLLEAQRKGAIATAANTNVQAIFGATNAGQKIAMDPRISPLADELLLSAGYEDANGTPLTPPAQPLAINGPLPPDMNTSPNFPPQADQGAMMGIEGGQ